MSVRLFKSFFKDYFTFTVRERRGACVLILLIMVNIFLIVYYKYIKEPDLPYIEPLALVKIEKSLSGGHSVSRFENQNSPSLITSELSFFDPNIVSEEELLRMGFSEKQVATINNFRNKGGRFRNADDFRKIYGISVVQFDQVLPFIRIENKKKEIKTFRSVNNGEKPVKDVLVNINTADTVELTKLPLIGSGRARMIFKYRELLGGFVSTEQLLEVFTIDTAVYNAVSSRVIINGPVRKVNFNSDSLYHPYLTKQQVMVIKNFRKQHGDFRNPEDLKQVKIIDNELFNKLVPYASFE